MKSYIYLSVILIFIFCTGIGCTTIKITESDSFDAHRTITPTTFDISSFTFNELSIDTEDGETLDAWFLEKENARGTVIYFGGNGFLMVKARPLIQAYANTPVNLLLFDYRGYGLSSGDPTIEGVKNDAIAVYNTAKNMLPSEDDMLIVHGHSLGSFVSAYIADEQSVDAYILESPISEPEEWTKQLLPWIARVFVKFDIEEEVATQNNTERVSRINIPLLVIGGTADDVTPFKMAEKLYDSSGSEYKTQIKIEGGSHNNLPKFQAYKNGLQAFINGL